MLKICDFYLFSLIVWQSLALPPFNSIESNAAKTVKNGSDRMAKQNTTHPNICTSEICAKESAQIVGSLNVSVDPCENFYEFVCGKYIHDTVLPKDKISEYTLSIAQDEVDGRLHEILFEEIQPNEPKAFKLAKTFYQLCEDMDTRNKTDIHLLLDILEPYGGWPVVKGDEWKLDRWNWLDMIKNMSSDGLPANFIFDVAVIVDTDDTTQNIIRLQRTSPEDGDEMLNNGLSVQYFQDHLNYMVNIARMSGASEARAKHEMRQVLKFEHALVKNFASKTYEKYTVQELEANYTHINWTDFLNWNLNDMHHVDKDEMVALNDVPNFVDYVENLINETPARTIANYIAWRFIEQNSKYLNDDLRKLHETDEAIQCKHQLRKLYVNVKKVIET